MIKLDYINVMDFWSKRYRNEGALWGYTPSVCAKTACDMIPDESDVLDIAAGYGRDIAYLAKKGHHVTGIDTSHVGIDYARDLLSNDSDVDVTLHEADFLSFPIEKQYDAVLCHRMLHLISKPDDIEKFVEKVFAATKVGGYIFIAARNPHDFSNDQMQEVEKGVAEYKNRPGHRISFWEEKRYKEIFGTHFDIIACEETSEIECSANPVASHITLMIARKTASEMTKTKPFRVIN